MNKPVTAIELEQVLECTLARCFGADADAWPVTPEQLSDALRLEVGGGEIYIPAASKEKRNKAMCRKFTGRNYEELANEFNLSVRQIQNIVNPRTELRSGRG